MELRKIEQRKRERDRKTQDLQKLITAADQADPRKSDKKSSKKSSTRHKSVNNSTSTVSILMSLKIKCSAWYKDN